jgi:CxxC motif-containing protein (DUF1111 family)
MRRAGLIAALALTLASIAAFADESGLGPLGGAGTRPLLDPNAFSFQLANSPREHQRPFSFGNRLFNTNWVQAPASVKSFDGLGPIFSRVSCSGCHTKDGRGQPPAAAAQGPMESMLLRISLPGTNAHGGPKPLPGYGDQLSERAIPGVASEGRAKISYEEVPGAHADGEPYSLRQPRYEIADAGYGAMPKEMLISPRVAPQVIGLGLLQAVPDQTLKAMADPDDKNGDGISGRPNMVWDKSAKAEAIGRFGWKANQPNLRQQNADAALGDLGLTTSVNAQQNCTDAQAACRASIGGGEAEISDEFLDKLTLYAMTLAVPAQRDAGSIPVKKGFTAFQSMGCAACHAPMLRTGEMAGFPEVSNQVIHPFTDLLLHDMGEGLADGRPDFEATGREWRTPPLWGLGLVPTINRHDFLLHDGRARGFAEAILWHGGEAERAKENFRAAPKETREALIAFLKSL